jgi:hypothetical protein
VGVCDYLATPYTSPLNQVTPPLELLEYRFIKQLLLNCKESTNKQIRQ